MRVQNMSKLKIKYPESVKNWILFQLNEELEDLFEVIIKDRSEHLLENCDSLVLCFGEKVEIKSSELKEGTLSDVLKLIFNNLLELKNELKNDK